MNVEAFLLCDCATDQQGKLNILGAFDIVYARKMPAVHPACTIAARLRYSRVEEGNHKIKINLIDADGNPAGPVLEREISLKVNENDNSGVRNIILNIQGLRLENFGDYRIDFAIDNRLEANLPLKVREVPEKV
jgi:hypothetical protein